MAMELDDPRLELITEPVRAAVAGVLGQAAIDDCLDSAVKLRVIATAWECVAVAMGAREAEAETAAILADPVTMAAIGDSEAELAGNADTVAEIVRACGGKAFYAPDGEVAVLTSDGQVISVCAHGTPVSARLSGWKPGYRS